MIIDFLLIIKEKIDFLLKLKIRMDSIPVDPPLEKSSVLTLIKSETCNEIKWKIDKWDFPDLSEVSF